MSISKNILTAAAVLAVTSVVAFQPKQASAMPRVNLDAQFMTADNVQKVGVKKRRIKRAIRRHVRKHRHYHRRHRHGHRHGHGYYRAYAGPVCHAHTYKVPGMGLHTRFRCNHAHFRAYDSWYWK